MIFFGYFFEFFYIRVDRNKQNRYKQNRTNCVCLIVLLEILGKDQIVVCLQSDKWRMTGMEFVTEDVTASGNSALDWEIFDILCKDELGINVSKNYTYEMYYYPATWHLLWLEQVIEDVSISLVCISLFLFFVEAKQHLNSNISKDNLDEFRKCFDMTTVICFVIKKMHGMQLCQLFIDFYLFAILMKVYLIDGINSFHYTCDRSDNDCLICAVYVVSEICEKWHTPNIIYHILAINLTTMGLWIISNQTISLLYQRLLEFIYGD